MGLDPTQHSACGPYSPPPKTLSDLCVATPPTFMFMLTHGWSSTQNTYLLCWSLNTAALNVWQKSHKHNRVIDTADRLALHFSFPSCHGGLNVVPLQASQAILRPLSCISQQHIVFIGHRPFHSSSIISRGRSLSFFFFFLNLRPHL